MTSDKCKANHIVGNSDLFWNVLYFAGTWMGGNTLPLSVKKVVGKGWCTEKRLFCSLGPNIKIIIKHFQYFWYIFALYWWKFKFLYLADNYANHESIPLSVLSISLILEGFERKLTFLFVIKKNLKLNEFISNLQNFVTYSSVSSSKELNHYLFWWYNLQNMTRKLHRIRRFFRGTQNVLKKVLGT